MFGASLQPAASFHHSVTHGSGHSPDAMHTPSAPRRNEHLERTIINELVPRLMTSHRVGPIPPSLTQALSRELGEADVAAFVAAIRSHDDTKAVQFVKDILAEGATVEAVYLDLLAPGARQLGTLWDNDECDFVEVTVALGRMQRLLRDLSQVFLADVGHASPVGNVLLSCINGEQHTLGIIMVGEFLLRDGWRVLVGAPWSDDDLLTMVKSEWYDVIGFSVGCHSRTADLQHEIRRLKAASRNPRLQIMVGGQMFAEDPALAEQIGANAIATSAREGPRVARMLLGASRAAAADDLRQEAPGDHVEFSEALRRD